MNSIFMLDSITPESLVWWLMRATLLAALGCASLALMLRARPSTRHAVAVASLVAIALLPVASAVLPTLSLPVLPASTPESIATPAVTRERPFAIDTPVSPATPASMATPALQETPSIDHTTGPASFQPAATVGRALLASARQSIGSVDWKIAVLLTWLTVTACLLLWTVLGAIGARRLLRRAAAPSDEALSSEYDRARRVLGIRRSIEIVVSRDVAIPMVVGALDSRVVLPASAATWSRQRLAVVLLHELAHVRRRDGLWMLVARGATAVFWFHPLVWVLSRHVRREAERACDEIVLASGVRGSDYAEHLVAIARTAMTRNPLAGSVLALATRSSLEQRVVAILATRVPRRGISRRALAALSGAALALFVAIAAARPTTVSSAQMTATDSNAVVEGQPAPVDAVPPTVPERVFERVLTNVATNVRTETKTKYYLAENDNDDERSGREWYDRASDLYHRERYSRAAEAYQNAAHRGYRRATALYNAGCSYALSDQQGRAIESLREAFDEGFDRPDLFAEDSDLNSLRGDPRFQKLLDDVMKSDSAQAARRDASLEFERLAKRSDVEDGEWNSVGIDLLRSGDYDHAAEAFDHEFQVSKDEDALYNQACARSLAGKKDEALKLLERAITTGSVDADHMAEDSDLMPLHSEKRFDELHALAEDLTLQGGSWWKYADGKWWNGDSEKRWRREIPRLERVTRDHPQVGRAWFNLGYAQLMAGDAAESTPSFQKALDLGYRPGTTMYNLGCSSAQSGDIDGALAWLEKAEGAGMKMWSYARWDDDLDPLRDDPRFKSMEKRWKAEAKKHGHDDDVDGDSDKDHDQDNDEGKDDTN